MSGAKKISQFPKKSVLDGSELIPIVDPTATTDKNKWVSPDTVKNYTNSGQTVDWNNIQNKPTTFPPDPHTHVKAEITDFAHTHVKADITDFAHTHTLSEITDFPSGVNGDLLVNNSGTWAAGDVIVRIPHSFFVSNANNVFRKNQILILQEDDAFFKITDGVTQLKNLRWYKSEYIHSTGSMAATTQTMGFSTLYNLDTMTNLPFRQLSNASFNNAWNNFIVGSYLIIPEYFKLMHAGFFVNSVTGGSKTFTVGIYSISRTGNAYTMTLLDSRPVVVSAVGIALNSSPFNLNLRSGLYMIAHRFSISSGSVNINVSSDFNFHQHFEVSSIRSRYLALGGSLPLTATELLNDGTMVTYAYPIYGERLLKNI